MPMTIRGQFQQTPFPALCLEIWRSRLTGVLKIQLPDYPSEIIFQEGDLALTLEVIDRTRFLEFLATQVKSIEKKFIMRLDQKAPSVSFVRSLIENSQLPAQLIWNYLRDFYLTSIQPLFELSEGNFSFLPHSHLPRGTLLIKLSSPEVVQQGIFRIQNLEQFQKFYPDKTVTIKLQKNSLPLPQLSEPAKYLLHLLAAPITLEELLRLSQLGEQETYRLLFLFSCFKMVNLSLAKTISRFQPASPQKLAQTIDLFLEKSALIFKYLSKEIGPVAANIIQKSISEGKSSLPAIFSEVEIDENGRINFGRVFKSGIAYASPETQAQIIEGLNELLLTQVLAVKKTLGDDHELRLIEALRSFSK